MVSLLTRHTFIGQKCSHKVLAAMLSGKCRKEVDPSRRLPEECHRGPNIDILAPVGIGVDGDFVYWAQQTGPSPLRRVPKNGGRVEDMATGQRLVGFSFVIANGMIHGVEAWGATVPNGRAIRMPLSGGAFTVLATTEALTSGAGRSISLIVSTNSTAPRVVSNTAAGRAYADYRGMLNKERPRIQPSRPQGRTQWSC